MRKITLTMNEAKRYQTLEMTLRGRITVAQAAAALGVSQRHAWRLKKRARKEGAAGMAHQNRGKPCARKTPPRLIQQILLLRRGTYAGFNDTHFTQKLKEEGIAVSQELVRRVLRKAGIGSPRKRRPAKYRSRREPKEQEGLMLQADGSHHDWLEGRGPRMCLVGLIDDATGRVPAAVFRERETTEGYFTVLTKTFRAHGLCHSLYADRHTIFHAQRTLTREEELAGKKQPGAQVGRALDELGVTLIPAYSPQAKGRIERLWGTFQDRLVSELRLANAGTMRQANRTLARFLKEHNRLFTRAAANATPAWRPLSKNLDLARVLCHKYRRAVARDNTIKFGGGVFQLPALKPFYSLAGKTVAR
ncbi:MAG: ISNCY family transposase [Nitrospinae bacterium]|nr:ISNCY family transposase [Nitrospinota bacterium]